MKTVNVVEHNGDNGVFSIRAFPETNGGNKKAEKLFTKIALENGMAGDNNESHLEDGYWSNGDYTVSLIHSENN